MVLNLLSLMLMATFVGGMVIVIRSVRGRPDWSNPTCLRCRYELRGLDPTTQTNCPECGADLGSSGAVHFARRQPSLRLMAIGGMMTAISLIVIASFTFQASLGSWAMKVRSNSSVIGELASNAEGERAWTEITDRYFNGQLSDNEVAAVIDHVIAHLQAGAGGVCQELSRSSRFVTVVLAQRRVSDEQFARLCGAYYGAALDVVTPARIRSGCQFAFSVSGMPWNLDGVTQIYALREVRLNDQPLQASTDRTDLPGLSGVAPWGITGRLMPNIAPGNYIIEFTFDVGVIRDQFNRFSPLTPPGPADQWPETIVRRVHTVKVPVRVLGPDESLISSVTPARDRESIVSGLRVVALRLGLEDGVVLAKLVFNPVERPPVSLSFRVFIRSGTIEEEIGSFTSNQDGIRISGFQKQIDSLPEDAKTVDVVFRPDPASVESLAGWTQIWGEQIVVHDVPVVSGSPRKDLYRQAVRASLNVSGIRLGAQHGRRIEGPGLDMSPVSTPPMLLRFRIYIRSGECEHDLGTLAAGDGQSTTSIPMRPVEDFPDDARVADVIFRPYPDGIAPATWKNYWDEEVVIADVPVIRAPVTSSESETTLPPSTQGSHP